jgi:anti-sigma B factor antagonist
VSSGRDLDSAERGADLGARVEHRGVRLGTVADVILDPRLRSVVGYEIDGVDGIRRFVPRIACGSATPLCLDVRVPTAMLGGAEIAFYRERGISLSALEDPGLGDRRNGYVRRDDPEPRGPVSSAFQASATDVGNGIAQVSVVGEADLYTAPELKAALAAAIDGGARFVLVDLSKTTFLDSTTLGVLMGGVRRLRPIGGEIAIVCSDPNIRKIFEITLLDRIFAILDDVAAGIAHLTDAAGAPADWPS